MGIFSSKQQNNESKETKAVIPPFTYQNMINHITHINFDSEYQLLQVLGKGSYAQVRKVKSKRSGLLRAVKIIDRIKFKKIEPMLIEEYDILKQLDHPCIVKVYEIFEEQTFYFIVSELCLGKQLFDYLYEYKKFSEKQAFAIFSQLASAVSYIHSRSIMHRDLKPQNIMYDPTSNNIKLIDFGSAIRFENDNLQKRRRVGTIYYVAPEVLNRVYNSKCDIWSMGVILYMMLSGQPPFKGKDEDEVMRNISKAEYDFKNNIWKEVSSQVKMLITEMFMLSPIKRIGIQKVFLSEWMLKNNQLKKKRSSEESLKKSLNNMEKYQKTQSNNIKSAVMIFMVNFIKKPEDEEEMQRCFRDLDSNGDGMLSMEELTLGLERFLKVSKNQAKSIASGIFKRIDTNSSGFIDYSQFLVAAKGIELAGTKENLELVFDCMDIDKNGTLTVEEIQKKLGENIPTQCYREMAKEFKVNKKGENLRQVNKTLLPRC